MSIDYAVGDTVVYRTFGGERRTVVVTARYEDVKNGEPGFDARSHRASGAAVGVWGYDRQIEAVLPASEVTA